MPRFYLTDPASSTRPIAAAITIESISIHGQGRLQESCGRRTPASTRNSARSKPWYTISINKRKMAMFRGMSKLLLLVVPVLVVSCGHGRPGMSQIRGASMIAIELKTYQVRHISVTINRPPHEVYSFVSNPENLPKWATGLGGSIRKASGEWVADSPMGKIKIKFAEKNKFGVLDHEVVLASGVKIDNPMRVIANGEGSEIFFTLIRQPDMSDEKFAEDARWVEKDLRILKGLLEGQAKG
ncbi:MAG: SRPBCC family protein [Nitrospirota bacterium]